jgi:hypothetical protein
LQPLRATAAISERRFGAIDTFDNPQAATQLGAGWTRVRFPWADMQPNDSGQWNTSFFTDGQLARELAAGREVAGLIVNTPPWALQDGNVPGVPSGLYLRDDDPNNVGHLRAPHCEPVRGPHQSLDHLERARHLGTVSRADVGQRREGLSAIAARRI